MYESYLNDVPPTTPLLDQAAITALFKPQGPWAKQRGTQVRQRRMRLGLTQIELANRCGVREATIHRIEMGIIVPSDRLRAVLGYVLESSPEAIWSFPSRTELEDRVGCPNAGVTPAATGDPGVVMDQLSMFPSNVRRSDPDTSRAAAVVPGRVTLRSRVAGVLRGHPAGLTDWEITARLGLPDRRKPSVAKRRQELAAVDTGRRRPSPDGLPCVVWRTGTD